MGSGRSSLGQGPPPRQETLEVERGVGPPCVLGCRAKERKKRGSLELHCRRRTHPFQSPPLVRGGKHPGNKPERVPDLAETQTNSLQLPWFFSVFFLLVDSGQTWHKRPHEEKHRGKRQWQEKSTPFTLLPAVCVVCLAGSLSFLLSFSFFSVLGLFSHNEKKNWKKPQSDCTIWQSASNRPHRTSRCAQQTPNRNKSNCCSSTAAHSKIKMSQQPVVIFKLQAANEQQINQQPATNKQPATKIFFSFSSHRK